MGILIALLALILTGMFWRYILKGAAFFLILGVVGVVILFYQEEKNKEASEQKWQHEIAELKSHDKHVDCKMTGSRSDNGVSSDVSYVYSFVINDTAKTVTTNSADEITRLMPLDSIEQALLASSATDNGIAEPVTSYDQNTIIGSANRNGVDYALNINRTTGTISRVLGNKANAFAIVEMGYCKNLDARK